MEYEPIKGSDNIDTASTCGHLLESIPFLVHNGYLLHVDTLVGNPRDGTAIKNLTHKRRLNVSFETVIKFVAVYQRAR